MKNKSGEYYKNIEKRYDLDRLRSKGAELFDIAYKYQFYGKRTKSLYLKLLYGLGYAITLYLTKKESTGALSGKK